MGIVILCVQCTVDKWFVTIEDGGNWFWKTCQFQCLYAVGDSLNSFCIFQALCFQLESDHSTGLILVRIAKSVFGITLL